jgi:hypothetical protein
MYVGKVRLGNMDNGERVRVKLVLVGPYLRE